MRLVQYLTCSQARNEWLDLIQAKLPMYWPTEYHPRKSIAARVHTKTIACFTTEVSKAGCGTRTVDSCQCGRVIKEMSPVLFGLYGEFALRTHCFGHIDEWHVVFDDRYQEMT